MFDHGSEVFNAQRMTAKVPYFVAYAYSESLLICCLIQRMFAMSLESRYEWHAELAQLQQSTLPQLAGHMESIQKVYNEDSAAQRDFSFSSAKEIDEYDSCDALIGVARETAFILNAKLNEMHDVCFSEAGIEDFVHPYGLTEKLVSHLDFLTEIVQRLYNLIYEIE